MAERLPKGQLTVAVILQALDVLERRRRPNRTVPIFAGGIEGRPVIGNCGQALRTEHFFGVQRIVPDHRVGAFRRRHVCGQRPQAGRGGNVRELLVFIQVEIEDNGKGIAAKDLPNIFDRFYRTDSSRNSAQGGSGIGLSIVRKIVEDHGGRIWATSKEGIGTEIHFVLRKYQEVLQDEQDSNRGR